MDIDKISRKEEKIKLGKKIAERVKDGQTIGFGSGSTSYLTAIEIGKKVEKEHLHIIAIPTSKEIENVCKQYKIQIGNLVENKIDWAFDGADEVDPDNNMIKGMGAAMFKEKLNILNSPINYILIDQTKFVKELGATETIFRGMTENQNAILDVRFEKIDNKLEAKIKNITGVIESGLFMGYNVEIISL